MSEQKKNCENCAHGVDIPGEYCCSCRIPVVGDVKPAEPLKEYNEQARREFGSYGGGRSKAEQLARSMTMRVSMGLR